MANARIKNWCNELITAIKYIHIDSVKVNVRKKMDKVTKNAQM